MVIWRNIIQLVSETEITMHAQPQLISPVSVQSLFITVTPLHQTKLAANYHRIGD